MKINLIKFIFVMHARFDLELLQEQWLDISNPDDFLALGYGSVPARQIVRVHQAFALKSKVDL